MEVVNSDTGPGGSDTPKSHSTLRVGPHTLQPNQPSVWGIWNQAEADELVVWHLPHTQEGQGACDRLYKNSLVGFQASLGGWGGQAGLSRLQREKLVCDNVVGDQIGWASI
jgi:hypothetical protein